MTEQEKEILALKQTVKDLTEILKMLMPKLVCPEPKYKPKVPCPICESEEASDPIYETVGAKCIDKFGEHLAKALVDPFDYAIGLKNGQIIQTGGGGENKLQGEWLILDSQPESVVGIPFKLERGVQIRISEIAWIADAPNGS